MTSFHNLSEELQNIAKKELNELPQRVNEDIEHIRSWILKQPHLQARTDDEVLTLFLRSSKFSLEKTKRRIELYYALKISVPFFFTNRDPLQPKFQYFFDQRPMCILPQIANKNVIVLLKTEKLDPDIITASDVVKLSMIIHEISLMEYASSSVIGQAFLFDLQNISFKYITQMTPELIKTTFAYYDVACPSRVKCIYFINTPRTFASLFNIMKSVVSKKLQERIFLHALGDKLDLEKYFPSSVLPFEYGGQGGSLSILADQSVSKIVKYRDWLIEDEKYKYVGSKPPTLVNVDMDLFASHGSFRNLEID